MSQLNLTPPLNSDRPTFMSGERVYVCPLQLEATVIRQQKCYDGPGCDHFWGNVELLYDDGVKGVSNSWQLKKLPIDCDVERTI